MFYTLLGTITAMLLGIVTFNLYGYDGLMANTWLNYTFWALILTGASLDFLLCWFCGHGYRKLCSEYC